MAWRASRVLSRPGKAERRRNWSAGPGPAGRGAPPAFPPPRGRGCSCSKWSERPDPGTCTLRAAWRRQTRYVGRRGPGRARRGSAMSRPRPTVGVVDYRKTPVVRRRRARPENGRRVQAGSVQTAGVGGAVLAVVRVAPRPEPESASASPGRWRRRVVGRREEASWLRGPGRSDGPGPMAIGSARGGDAVHVRRGYALLAVGRAAPARRAIDESRPAACRRLA